MNWIIFDGGIHGVGKSAVCKSITDKQDDLHYYSSSELINWENSKDKEVIDVQGNQDILVQALESLLDEIGTNSILLDGHFWLLTCSGCIQEVPLSTFINMNPSLIIVISADEEVVKNRLKTRDNKDYDIDFLREFQSCEKEYAKQVASVLKLPCFILTADESDLLLDIIKPYIWASIF